MLPPLLLLLVVVVLPICALVDDKDSNGLDVPVVDDIADAGCLRGGFQITKVLHYIRCTTCI